MNLKQKTFFLLPVCLAALVTCTKHEYSANACFNDDVLPIFVSNCTMSGCHNSIEKEEGYDLTSYEGIMKGIVPKHPARSEIFEQISGASPEMPPAPHPKLSKQNVHTIEVWIKNGALNTVDCGSCDTTQFAFNADVNPILQSWCVGCHNSNNKGGGFDFTTYTGVVAAISNNKLIGSINHSAGFSPMPKNGQQLSICNITTITKWVNSGYPNN